MNRILVIAGLLLGLTTGAAGAQTRVGVAVTFGEPHFAGHIVIGSPYYPRYAHPYYYGYRPAPYYFEPRVVVVRPYRYRRHRYHHNW